MYKQENKAGVHAFLLVIGTVLLLFIISEFLGGLIGFVSRNKINASLAGQLILVAFCIIMVVSIYNHYASVFNYKITSKEITIEKKTGRKITEYTIPIEKIHKVYIKKGMPHKLKGKKLRLCSSIINNKKISVIICEGDKKVIIFEPDDKFIEKMKEYIND